MMSNFQRIIADQAEEAWEHPCIERAKSKECLRIKTEDLQLFRMLGEAQLLWSLEIGGQSTFKMTTAWTKIRITKESPIMVKARVKRLLLRLLVLTWSKLKVKMMLRGKFKTINLIKSSSIFKLIKMNTSITMSIDSMLNLQTDNLNINCKTLRLLILYPPSSRTKERMTKLCFMEVDIRNSRQCEGITQNFIHMPWRQANLRRNLFGKKRNDKERLLQSKLNKSFTLWRTMKNL